MNSNSNLSPSLIPNYVRAIIVLDYSIIHHCGLSATCSLTIQSISSIYSFHTYLNISGKNQYKICCIPNMYVAMLPRNEAICYKCPPQWDNFMCMRAEQCKVHLRGVTFINCVMVIFASYTIANFYKDFLMFFYLSYNASKRIAVFFVYLHNCISI